LTEKQPQCLEKYKNEREAHGEIKTKHPGYLVLVDFTNKQWLLPIVESPLQSYILKKQLSQLHTC